MRTGYSTAEQGKGYQEEHRRLPELGKWSWKSRKIKVVRIHKTVYQISQSWTMRTWEMYRGYPRVFSRVLFWCIFVKNNLWIEKEPYLKRIEVIVSRAHIWLGLLPFITAILEILTMHWAQCRIHRRALPQEWETV